MARPRYLDFATDRQRVTNSNSGRTIAHSVMRAGDTVYRTLLTLYNEASAVNNLKVTASATGNDVVMEPIGSDTNIGLTIKGKGAGSVTVTGVTFSAGSLTGTDETSLACNADASTPKIRLLAPDSGTGNYTVSLSPAATLTANRTATFPDAAGNVVLDSATQTLSGKTLTTPTIADLTNATHSHTNAAGGGTINGATALSNFSAAGGAAKVVGTDGSGNTSLGTGALTCGGATVNGTASVRDVTAQSGAYAVDLSGATGLFKTPTGAGTLSGETTVAAGKNLHLATGGASTGYVKINGKTTGSLKLTTADETGQDLVLTTAAQSTGGATITIPDLGGTSCAPVLTAKDQTIAGNKTFQGTVQAATLTDGTISSTAGAVTGALNISGATVTYRAITTSDLSATAGVTVTQLEGLADGQVVVGVDGTAANNAKVTVTGDVTMANTGVATLNAAHQEQLLHLAVEDLTAGADITDRPIFVHPRANTLTSVGILTQGAPVGVDDDNTAVVTLKDDAGNTIVAKTYNTGTQPPTSDYEDLGALDGTHKALSAGEHVTLSVAQGATANLPAFQLIVRTVPTNA